MTDNQRDALLSDLREAVAKLATALPLMQERVLERLGTLDQTQRTMLEKQGQYAKRLNELEGWRREVSSLGSARSSAFTKGLAILGMVLTVVGMCSGALWAIFTFLNGQ